MLCGDYIWWEKYTCSLESAVFLCIFFLFMRVCVCVLRSPWAVWQFFRHKNDCDSFVLVRHFVLFLPYVRRYVWWGDGGAREQPFVDYPSGGTGYVMGLKTQFRAFYWVVSFLRLPGNDILLLLPLLCPRSHRSVSGCSARVLRFLALTEMSVVSILRFLDRER